MEEDSSLLMGLDFVADILKPTTFIVWGTLAVANLGSHAVHSDYMLGIPDAEMDTAAKKLVAAGFTRQNWSYGSSIDPATRVDDEGWNNMMAMIAPAYVNIDKKSMNFQPPLNGREIQRTILLPESYIRLSVANSRATDVDTSICGSQPLFYVQDNIYWPNAVILLQSFLMVHMEEEEVPVPNYRSMLMAWAVSYLYQELQLREDILDSCNNPAVKETFDEYINRSQPRPKREKWGRLREPITNDMIREYQ